MSAVDVLAEAEAVGVRLEVVDDKLRWQGRASPELLDRLRTHKLEVMNALCADPAEAPGARLWSDDDPTPLAEPCPYGYAPELPADDEHAAWLRGGRDEAPPLDETAFAQMRRDMATVVQDLLAAGQKPGRVRALFGLTRAELDELAGGQRWGSRKAKAAFKAQKP